MHARLWGKGSSSTGSDITLKDGKLPAGGYIFPFEFAELPEYIPVTLRVTEREKEGGSALVLLPPSYRMVHETLFDIRARVFYYVKISVEYVKMHDLPAIYDIPFTYYPCARPMPRAPSGFPFFGHRDDWPYKREEIGGWTITPFGGRGRFKNQVVEIEGLLGVEAPEVHTFGQRVKYGLLLWSSSPEALEALSHPDCFDVVFMSSDLFGPDALRPSNRAHRNRYRTRLSQGRIWRTDDGPPRNGRMPELRPDPAQKLPKAMSADIAGSFSLQPAKKRASSHLKDSITVSQTESSTASSETRTSFTSEDGERSPSTSSSVEDGNELHGEKVVRLDGDIVINQVLPPSFRYEYMGREYTINVFLSHPDYSHISPSGPGIEGETPLWVVLDPTPPENARVPKTPRDFSTIPIVGEVTDVGANPTLLPLVIGGASNIELPKNNNESLGPQQGGQAVRFQA
ncbi:hypothetical protein M422DRAFT_68054 [Sphaerobolus stellatus SS14]|uniref:Arrestin-like N-terminal domain-containing protein n=1 Tax=Sphaerobolus stellatus (strain SS14) TaxID=990650 RepID=A0A0C9VKN1_SPHS4|nr:hypothetical protein M422DRAFT_68054 [Sphaerobolus stellatus SS14]